MTGYKNTSTKLTQNITIFVQKDDLTLLKRQYNNLKLLGLVLDFFMDGLTIYEVPLCIYNKSKKGVICHYIFCLNVLYNFL